MTREYVLCARCASDECEHAMEPSQDDLWHVVLDRATTYEAYVVADSRVEAETALREAVTSAWNPSGYFDSVTARRCS